MLIIFKAEHLSRASTIDSDFNFQFFQNLKWNSWTRLNYTNTSGVLYGSRNMCGFVFTKYYIQPIFMKCYIQPIFMKYYIQPIFMKDYIQPIFMKDYIQPIFMKDYIQPMFMKYYI